MGEQDQSITITIKFVELKKHYNLSCPNPSITWKEFITSNSKVPFAFGDEYILQRQVPKNGKMETLTFFGHHKISDYLKTFKKNRKNYHVKVVKKPINLKSPIATKTATETVAPRSEPRPSTSGNTNTNAKSNSNCSSPQIIFIKPAVRPVSPAITLSKRGPGRNKVKLNNSPTGAGNIISQASAPVSSPRGQKIKKDLFNQNMKIPIPMHKVTEAIPQFKFPNGVRRSVNGYSEGDNDNVTIMSESTQEDLSLEDIKAIIVQRFVKKFTNTDFHRMVNEYHKLKSKDRVMKLCRLLPFTGNCLDMVFQAPFKK